MENAKTDDYNMAETCRNNGAISKQGQAAHGLKDEYQPG